MSEFRLIQISDTHLARHFPAFTDNFNRICDYIDTHRPHLVVNSGDLTFDAPTSPGDIDYARALHEALPVPCRYLPGNHDIGDNPTQAGPAPTHPVTEQARKIFVSVFGEDHWRFDAAGWCFIGLNSLLMNSGLASETEQFEWLASQLAISRGRPVALFLHKPLFLNTPADPEVETTAIRYVPLPARRRLIEMLRAHNVKLIAAGHLHQQRELLFEGVRHVWAPSSAFVLSDRRQEVMGVKDVGLVQYAFRPDGFEVRHVKVPGQTTIELEAYLSQHRQNAAAVP